MRLTRNDPSSQPPIWNCPITTGYIRREYWGLYGTSGALRKVRERRGTGDEVSTLIEELGYVIG
jgi:hypothetical protein